jgi:hypothetical protein
MATKREFQNIMYDIKKEAYGRTSSNPHKDIFLEDLIYRHLGPMECDLFTVIFCPTRDDIYVYTLNSYNFFYSVEDSEHRMIEDRLTLLEFFEYVCISEKYYKKF